MHRIPVEEPKTGDVKGRYLHPEEHGQKASKGIKLPKAAQRSAPKAPKLEHRDCMTVPGERHGERPTPDPEPDDRDPHGPPLVMGYLSVA